MRVVVYDRTCGLTAAWAVGSSLYRGLGRVDAVRGVASWREALSWLVALRAPLREIQYWGHGTWGAARVAADVLDRDVLSPGHAEHPLLEAVRERLVPGALVWFRTCQTFGARPGIAFAEHLADFLGVRVAGHTYVIGFHQSGLHGLAPGKRADWSPDEGLAAGSPEAPRRAKGSRPWAPRTITCLHGAVPEPWFGARSLPDR